jgi:hypothetical protein
MKIRSLFPAALIPLVSSAGLAVWQSLVSESPGFTFFSHAFRPRPVLLAALFALAVLTITAFWLIYSLAVSRLLAAPFEEVLRRDARTYLPLAFAGLAPGTLVHYLSAADVLVRSRLLLAGTLALVIMIKVVQFRSWRKRRPGPLPVRLFDPSKLSPRKKSTALFLAALAVFNLGSLVLIGKGMGFSGDEPHYLLMAHSLLHEGDLDLADNYAREDYRAYQLKPVTIPQRHVVAGRKEGTWYSFHSPGTAFLMLPFYAVGSAFGKASLILWLRFGMSLFGALFVLQVFLFAREVWGDEKRAFILWAIVAFVTPVFFYAIHIYPEMIIAFLSFYVFRRLHSPAPFRRGLLLLIGLLISVFIWFHAIKYVLLAGPLLLYGCWVLRARRARAGEYASYLFFPALVTAAYLVFQKSLYGSFSLSAVSWKGSLEAGETLAYLKELVVGIPFRFRWETLAGYFFDQKDGLLFYAPVYILAFPGLVEMARRNARDFRAILFVTSPYILVSAFLTQRTGYAPQARPLTAVIWALIIGLGSYLASRAKGYPSRTLSFLAGASFLMTGLLLWDPVSLYQETTVGSTERGGRIFYALSNLHFHLTDFLPSYIKSGEGRWLPNILWPAAIVVFILVYALARRGERNVAGKARKGIGTAAVIAAGAVFFLAFVWFPRTPLLGPVNTAFPTGERLTFHSMSRVARQVEPGRFLLPEDGRAYVFSFTSWRRLEELRFEFGSGAGAYEVEVDYFDQPLFGGGTDREFRTLDLPAPPPYRLKGAYLYMVTIRLDKKSGSGTAETPYLFRIVPAS